MGIFVFCQKLQDTARGLHCQVDPRAKKPIAVEKVAKKLDILKEKPLYF